MGKKAWGWIIFIVGLILLILGWTSVYSWTWAIILALIVWIVGGLLVKMVGKGGGGGAPTPPPAQPGQM